MSIPGLPALPPAAAALFQTVQSLVGDAINGTAGSQSQWGVFLNGEQVVVSDNVISFEFMQEFKISNYPVEQGSFASYNKVQQPFEIKFRFSTGGSSSDHQQTLASIASVIADTNLYTVATPDATYSNLNFVRQDYRQSSDRIGLLVIDVACEEVRPASLGSSTTTTTTPDGTTTSTSTTQISIIPGNQINSPQSAGASPIVNGGTVQPQDPTPAQQNSFSDGLAQVGGAG